MYVLFPPRRIISGALAIGPLEANSGETWPMKAYRVVSRKAVVGLAVRGPVARDTHRSMPLGLEYPDDCVVVLVQQQRGKQDALLAAHSLTVCDDLDRQEDLIVDLTIGNRLDSASHDLEVLVVAQIEICADQPELRCEIVDEPTLRRGLHEAGDVGGAQPQPRPEHSRRVDLPGKLEFGRAVARGDGTRRVLVLERPLARVVDGDLRRMLYRSDLLEKTLPRRAQCDLTRRQPAAEDKAEE